MNPAKRKWLARLEAAKKVQEVVKKEELQPLPLMEVPVAQPIVEEAIEEVVEAPAVVEEAPAPVVSSKKKRS